LKIRLSRTEYRTLLLVGAVLGYWMGHYDPSPALDVVWFTGAGWFTYQLGKSFLLQFDEYLEHRERRES
jgi:hypothetical protein